MLRSNQPDIKSLEIREVSHGDIPALERIFTAGMPDKHNKRLKKQLDNNALYLLAIIHGKIVGHVLLNWEGMDEVKEMVTNCPALEDLYVEPVYRSRGIGTKLVEECIDRAKNKGYAKVGLGVGATNVKAKQFYHHLGFLDSGIPDFYVGWGYIDRDSNSEKRDGEMCRYFVKHL